MKNNFLRAGLLVFCLLTQIGHSFAQEDYNPKLGLIDRASLETTAFPGDSSAEAVKLYDYGNVSFAYESGKGIYMITQRRVRIKILKQSALDRASVKLRYQSGDVFSKSERISEIKGYTYNLEGGQIITSELSGKSVFDGKLGEGYYAVTFNLPNVKKGCVIEYTYTRETPLHLTVEPETWEFQSSIPVKWSEYRFVTPYYLDYKITMFGYLGLFINKQEQVDVSMGLTLLNGPGLSYRFVVKDAPAFTNEPFITTEKDYLSKLRFELASTSIPGEPKVRYSQTWEQVDNTFRNSSMFGTELGKNVVEDELIKVILQTNPDSVGRMKSGYALVTKSMKWDGYSTDATRDGLKKAYGNKKGNAAELNLLLVNVLRKLDLDADPVVLSTRSHGLVIEKLPLLNSFNYVVCLVKIGSKEYFLDATEPNAKIGMLPERALNGMGRVIPKKKGGYFIDLKPKENKGQLEIVEAELQLDQGILKGKYAGSISGYEALNWRNKYLFAADDVFTADVRKQAPEWEISGVKVSNQQDLESAVNYAYDFEIEEEAKSPDIFYFNPMLVGRLRENPLKSNERIYPLDFGAGSSTSFIGKFKLPAHYVLEEVPKAEVLALPNKAGRFVFIAKQTGDLLEVNSSISINKVIFTAEEYHALREFFERVVKRHAQPLVIKKKK